MFKRLFEGRRAWFAALLLVAICLAPGVASGQAAEDPTAEASPAGALDERFTRPPEDVTLPAIPSDPVETLITATNAHSASLGYPVDHRSTIENANLSDEDAGRLALLMQAVLVCDGTETEEVRTECAAETNDAAAGLIQTDEESGDVQTQGSSGDVETQGANDSPCDIDAWPSLCVDEDGSDDKYIHDYAVLQDTGGNDVYDNNSGANLLDTLKGPDGSAALEKKPAVGCEHPQITPAVPPTIPAPFDCASVGQAVLIDEGSGKDVHGVFKAPRKRDESPLPPDQQRNVDGDCTNDKVIRRIVIQGSGFMGNSLLMDDGGNDTYNGKTNAQGSGHVGGIGILRDLGKSKDEYLAIRNAQGFALVGTPADTTATGLLQDDGGDDKYHIYMPKPIDPFAWFNTPKSGGVIDDLNQCDSLSRQVQGAAILGGNGAVAQLLDQDGEDFYEGRPPDSTLFEEPALFLQHSSQGFGCDNSIGILTDEGKDEDTYIKGPKNRRDGVSIQKIETDCALSPGQSIFEDDGPKKGNDNCSGGKDGKKGKKGKKNGNGKDNGKDNGKRDCK